MTAPATTPYLVKTPRLILRPWEFADAAALAEATARSREHLVTFLAWAALEPQTIDDKYALVRRLRGQFDLEIDHTYGIFLADGRTPVGGTGLHNRIGPGAREIGYWTDVAHVRKGYAGEATAALTKVGFELLGLRKIEIRVQPENTASLAIPRRLGYTDTGLLRGVCPDAQSAGYHDARIFSMLADEYAASQCAALRVQAFDGLGRAIERA